MCESLMMMYTESGALREAIMELIEVQPGLTSIQWFSSTRLWRLRIDLIRLAATKVLFIDSGDREFGLPDQLERIIAGFDLHQELSDQVNVGSCVRLPIGLPYSLLLLIRRPSRSRKALTLNPQSKTTEMSVFAFKRSQLMVQCLIDVTPPRTWQQDLHCLQFRSTQR